MFDIIWSKDESTLSDERKGYVVETSSCFIATVIINGAVKSKYFDHGTNNLQQSVHWVLEIMKVYDQE